MLPRFQRGAFALFSLTLVTTILLGDLQIADSLRFDVLAVSRGERLWQPLSSLFLVPESQISALVLTLVVQWFLGSALIRLWGTRRYLLMVMTAGLSAHAVLLAVTMIWPSLTGFGAAGGPAPMDMAVAIAFAVVYGRQELTLWRGQAFSGRSVGLLAAALVGGVVCLQLVSTPAPWAQAWPLLLPITVAAGVSWLFVTQPWRSQGKSGRPGGMRKKKANNRSHLQVVRNADDLLN